MKNQKSNKAQYMGQKGHESKEHWTLQKLQDSDTRQTAKLRHPQRNNDCFFRENILKSINDGLKNKRTWKVDFKVIWFGRTTMFNFTTSNGEWRHFISLCKSAWGGGVETF